MATETTNRTLGLTIDPEFERICPPLTGEEFEQLQENILEDQVIYMPIVVWNGIIIDGHHRYSILKKHPNLKYTILEKDFANRNKALAWICKNQLGRRNLTPEQRKYLIGQRYEAERHSHGASDGYRGNQYDKLWSQNENIGQEQRTCDRIAEESHVSASYVKRAGPYSKGIDAAEEVLPGIRQEILSGTIKPTDAQVVQIVKAPPEERKALVEALLNPPLKEKPIIPEKSIELKNQERAERSARRERLRKIRVIGEEMLVARSTFGEDDVIRELKGAVDEMISRWDLCEGIYPQIVKEASCQARILPIAEQLIDFLTEKKKRAENATATIQGEVPENDKPDKTEELEA